MQKSGRIALVRVSIDVDIFSFSILLFGFLVGFFSLLIWRSRCEVSALKVDSLACPNHFDPVPTLHS